MKAMILTQQPSWQHALTEMITSPQALLAAVEVDEQQIAWQWDKTFPVRVTQSFVARMKKGDANDPLLRQVLSTPEESQLTNGYHHDPLKEQAFNPLPGLLHKYSSRVLLTFTPSCAIHCRYCFRRHFPYDANNPGRQGWQQTLDYIANDPNILEVILSGGDPLMAQDSVIEDFVVQLNKIPHVQLLRFHTRLPVVIPNRITDPLITLLKAQRLKSTLVYHINHANELTSEIADYVASLKKAQITVLNQTVLLRGINDSENELIKLSLALFKAGILPYYVHLLDKVQGAAHFAVPLTQATALQQALRHRLPGYLVPKFVQEVAEAPSKMPLEEFIEKAE